MAFLRIAMLLALWAPCSCFVANQRAAALPSHAMLGSVASLSDAVLPPVARRCSELLMQKGNKPKKDMLELEGVVEEALPNAMFRVKLDDTEQVILCVISGKIRKNFIKILVGDHVTCEISPYDLTKGRITFRRR